MWKLTAALAIAVLASCKGRPAKHDKVAPAGDATVLPTDATFAVDAAARKPARPEHAVWNLVDNRHTAHRSVEGELVLDGRTVSFARFTRFGMPAPQWQLGASVGGERAALASKSASVEIPIIPEQPAPTQLTLRVHGEDKQVLEVRVNGMKPAKRGRIPLEAGWQTIAVPVEPGAFVEGENVLALQTSGKSKAKVGLSWLRAGTTHPAGDHDPLAAATFDPAEDAIELANHATLTWYVTIPEGAHLVAEVTAPCFVEVGARAGDASFTGGLLGGDQDRVDLSAMAGKTVRLSLATRDCPRAKIVHPRITIHGPEPVALPRADPPRLVVLWRLSGLRADPGFDELARASTVFRQFEWMEIDRAAVGTAVATAAKLQAVLMTDATVDALLGHLDKLRESPMFLYADTSREQSSQLGRVVAQLRSWGLWDQTLLVVADEHELVIHDAARYPSGTIVDEGAETMDVVPSILDALGVAPVASHGVSLAPLAQGLGRGWARPSFATVAETTHVLRLGRWTIRVGNTGVPVVIDAVDDAVGARDLASSRPIERRMLTDALGLLLPLRTQWKKAEWGVVSNLSPAGARALDEAPGP